MGCTAAIAVTMGPSALIPGAGRAAATTAPASSAALAAIYRKRMNLVQSNIFSAEGRILDEIFPGFTKVDIQTQAEAMNAFVKEWMRFDIRGGTLNSARGFTSFIKSLGGFKTPTSVSVFNHASSPAETLQKLLPDSNAKSLTDRLTEAARKEIENRIKDLEDVFKDVDNSDPNEQKPDDTTVTATETDTLPQPSQEANVPPGLTPRDSTKSIDGEAPLTAEEQAARTEMTQMVCSLCPPEEQ